MTRRIPRWKAPPIWWASGPPCWPRCVSCRPGQRAVVVLRYWEDLTDAQIAVTLGCSPGTVRSQLSRALAKLRENPVLGEGEPG